MAGKIGKALTRMQRSKGNLGLRAVLGARSSTRYSAVADLCDTSSTPTHTFRIQYGTVRIHYSDRACTNGVGDIFCFFRISNLPLPDRLPTYLRTGHVLSCSREESPTTLNNITWSATSSGGLHAVSSIKATVAFVLDMTCSAQICALNCVPNLSQFSLHYTIQ